MKPRLIILFTGIVLASFTAYTVPGTINSSFYGNSKDQATFSFLKDGDIIFQVSVSGQGKAIQLATKSKYTHVGIIFKHAGEWMVFEAVQPVRWTRLESFIKHGDDQHYVIKRLKNRDMILSEDEIKKMYRIAGSFNGKNYDPYFDWSDKELYCSEVVWKIYQRGAGIELGELQKMKEFDLTSEEVKKKLKERFGDQVPLEQNVISPAAIFESDLIETVKQE